MERLWISGWQNVKTRRITHDTVHTPTEKEAMIHSLKEIREVEILADLGGNQFYARYNGQVCTAIFNIFRNCFYVDDIYGVVSNAVEEGR